MRWTSWSEFLAMGGYGLYVWGTYGVALLLMVLEPLWVARRRRRAAEAARDADAWDDEA